MAENGLATASAGEADAGAETTKAELQRQMEEARESIAHTVTEIKETVNDQYESVKQSVADTFDWREQFKKHPVEWGLGALVVGLAVGYKVADSLEDTEAFERLHDALEPLVERATGGISDATDWLADQLPKVEDVVGPALVAGAMPVIAKQLKELLGIEIGNLFTDSDSGGKKNKKSGKRKKKGARKGKGAKGRSKDKS